MLKLEACYMKKYEYHKSELEHTDVYPSHWVKDKVFRIAHLITSGGTPSSGNEAYYDGDIFWVQSGDLNDSYISDTEKKITIEGLNNSSAKMFPEETLLIAMYGATIGKLGILTMEACTNQACCAIILSKKVLTKYLFYFFQAIKDNLLLSAYGGGQPNISQGIIKQTYLYYPKSIKEQQSIVNYLEKACSDIDDVTNALVGRIKVDDEDSESQINVLRQYRKSLIHEVVTGKKQVYFEEAKSKSSKSKPELTAVA